jgi:hypothetical protein
MSFTAYPKPAFRLTVDGRDITNTLSPRLISLTLTECASEESDQLDLTLSDTDGLLAIPPCGALIRLHIGLAGERLVDKGSFTVDEVEHSGAPDQITLRARTANLTASFRQIQEVSFHETTLGHIIDILAFKNDLHPGIAESLRNIPVTHLDQTRESDAAFLRRLGQQYDAVATVKNDTLLFIPKDQNIAASGKKLSTIHLTRQQGDHHRYHSAERDSYTGVRSHWYDTESKQRHNVVAGDDENSKHLRTTFTTEASARQAATAEWQRLQRGVATFELTLALGNPTLIPTIPVKVSGFKTTIDRIEWQVTKVTHRISKSGFTSRVEMEMKTQV